MVAGEMANWSRKLGKGLTELVLLAIVTFLIGCDEMDCEEQCGEGEESWYEDCEECADGVLFENECADIWCS